MGLGERAAAILAAALGLAVLLVVANTTRMTIQGRRAEIEIAKLFGATDAFVRRPFLYTGLWYGLLGGMAAWLCLAGVGFALAGPVAHLAGLYGSDFRLQGLGFETAGALVLGGGTLGLAGAWLAVGRYLRALTP
jgi:cell division transport system permease protein